MIPSSTNAKLLTNPMTLLAAKAGTVTIATVCPVISSGSMVTKHRQTSPDTAS